MAELKLLPEDPVIFAKCDDCDQRGPGVPIGPLFAKAFNRRKWSRNPVCDNCGGKLRKLFEIDEA